MKNNTPSDQPTKIIHVDSGAAINIGLSIFEDALRQQGVRVISVHVNPAYKVPQDLQSILNDII